MQTDRFFMATLRCLLARSGVPYIACPLSDGWEFQNQILGCSPWNGEAQFNRPRTTHPHWKPRTLPACVSNSLRQRTGSKWDSNKTLLVLALGDTQTDRCICKKHPDGTVWRYPCIRIA